MISTLDDRLAALAAHGLPGARRPPADGWAAPFDDVCRHGLAGFLALAWEEGVVELDDATVDRLEARLDAEAQLAVRLEAELLRLGPLLDQLGAVVLKGAVLAHEAYPCPSLRPFTDVDLLVPVGGVRKAVDGLLALGYGRPRPDPCPRFAERVAKATVLTHPAGLAVDLHRTLVAGNLGEGIDIDAIVAERRVARAGPVPVPAPGWDAHLVEVALHAVVGDELGRAISLRDVAQVAAHPAVDPDRVIALARRWRVGPAVATGLLAAHHDLGAALPGALAAWAGARPDAPLLIGDHDSFTARSRIDEMRRGGLARRLTLARSLVAPSPTFLRWRYGDHPLPTLYRRRWRELRHRAADARRPLTTVAVDDGSTP